MPVKLSGDSGEMWFHGVVSNIMLVAHTKKSPDALTWTAMCSAMGQLLQGAGSLRTCVFTDGGGPSRAQRNEVAQVATGSKHRISVISSAAAVRFIASSFALFNSTIKIFSPADWRDGLSHLPVSQEETDEIERVLRRLVAAPKPARFGTIAQALGR